MAVPKVSVVIPVYNRPASLRRAIDSVIAQSYDDYEVIVVDDGSTEDVRAVVEAAADNRIQLLRQASNRGAAAARNVGLRRARGEYVALLDSDDEWLPHKLAAQVTLFEMLSPRVGVLHSWYIDVVNDQVVSTRSPRTPASGNLRRKLTRELDGHFIGGMSTLVFRRATLLEADGFDEAMPTWEDSDLFLRVADRGWEFHFLFDVVAVKHRRDCAHRPGQKRVGDLAPFVAGLDRFWDKHKSRFGPDWRFRAKVAGYYWGYGRTLCAEGDLVGARVLFARAASIWPLMARAYAWWCVSHIGVGNYGRVRQLRNAFIGRAPTGGMA